MAQSAIFHFSQDAVSMFVGQRHISFKTRCCLQVCWTETDAIQKPCQYLSAAVLYTCRHWAPKPMSEPLVGQDIEILRKEITRTRVLWSVSWSISYGSVSNWEGRYIKKNLFKSSLNFEFDEKLKYSRLPTLVYENFSISCPITKHMGSILFEPHHEKTCLCHMRTTKAQIKLRIRPVWSAPLLFAV